MKKTIRFITSKNLFLLISLVLQLSIIIMMFTTASFYTTKILGGTTTIIAFVLALHINDSSLHPDIKLAYIIMLVLLPVYGLLTFIFSKLGMGNRKFNKHLKRIKTQTVKLNQNDEALNNLDSLSQKGIANFLYQNSGFSIYQNTTSVFYNSGQDLFNSMLEEINKAQKFIFLEYFIVEEGQMMTALLDAIKKKVDEGVEVRFMYDGTSSISKIPHSFCKKLQNMGIKSKMFLPIRAILSTEQNNRDHRKLCIIDNRIAFTGGINIADEYINAIKKFGYWKDVGIKIEGQAVESYTQMFLKMWNMKQKTIEDFNVYLKYKYNAVSDGFFIPFSDHPHNDEDVTKYVILQTLANAERYVHITTPYLILDDELRIALINATKRGIDVSIITPAVPDKKIIYAVTQSNYRKLIQNGVKIYKYQPGFIHAKMIVSDDKIAILGTVNLDYRSLYLNFENCIYMYKNSQIELIEQDFQDCISKSKLITIEEYKKINIFTRGFGRILKILAPLL